MPNAMARRLLSQRASARSKPGSSGAREPAAAKKPWWRFWDSCSQVPRQLLSAGVRRKESSYGR
jgi:hypothetical protein